MLVYPLAALIGAAISLPLAAWGNRLLATLDLKPEATQEHAVEGGITPPLHPTGEGARGRGLPIAWQWALRLALAAILPLLAWRVTSHPGPHLPLVAQWTLLSACAAVLVLAAVIDGATHLIFVEVIAPPAVLVGAVALVEGAGVWPPLLVGMLVAGGALLLVYLLGQVCFEMEALGWGDVQLGVVLGALLGWTGALRALV